MKLAKTAKLYVNASGRRYVDTGYTVGDFDKLEAENTELKLMVTQIISANKGFMSDIELNAYNAETFKSDELVVSLHTLDTAFSYNKLYKTLEEVGATTK